MKNKVFALALVVMGVLVSGSFAADRHIRVGGNLALGYNTVGNVDESFTMKKWIDLEHTDAFVKTELSHVKSGASNFGGFGADLGASVDFPITEYISLRGNVLLSYRMHSGNIAVDSVITKYSDATVTQNWKKETTNSVRISNGDHSFNQFNVDIPILCHMLLPTGDESGFYAEVGPVFTLNLNTSTDDMVAKAEDINTFTMGISAGVGRPLPFVNVPVDVDVHLTFGFLSMAKDIYFSPTDITIRIGATYWFL